MATVKALLNFLFIVITPVLCHSQLNFDYTVGKFLIKGTVTDVQTKKPVPSVNIHIVNNNKGISGDNDGNFLMYVTRKDTLKFTSTGYISKVIYMANIDSGKYNVLQVELMRDFIKLKEVTIYPFRDLDEFKTAFINKKNTAITIVGIAPPQYSTKVPTAKIYNPVSFLYERLKRKRRVADPDFKP